MYYYVRMIDSDGDCIKHTEVYGLANAREKVKEFFEFSWRSNQVTHAEIYVSETNKLVLVERNPNYDRSEP